MVPIITFAAWSGTGKTTYLEKLLPRLKAYGLRVGVLKHDAHGFDMDTPGTDTDRLTRSGADAVAIASPGGFAYLEWRPMELEEIARYFHGMDLVLTEGYKSGPFPKIALYRRSSGQPLAVPADTCLAIVSDAPLEAPCPVFPLDDPAPMAAFLVDWLMEKKGDWLYVHHA